MDMTPPASAKVWPALLHEPQRHLWIDPLRDVGRLFYDRGWSVGTSSNYSVVTQREPLELLITASGKDKRALQQHDFVVVDSTGTGITPDQPRPSAETMLHVVLAQQAEVGAVLHTHSIWGVLLSDLYFGRGAVPIAGYEMLKGLAGITTHESSVEIKIYENTQDISTLAQQLAHELHPAPPVQLRYGFLMRNHGLYTWGKDLAEARRHIEILEYLFEVVARRLMLPQSFAE